MKNEIKKIHDEEMRICRSYHNLPNGEKRYKLHKKATDLMHKRHTLIAKMDLNKTIQHI